MATEKQRKAVAKIVENSGNVSKSMREVGYSKITAKNPIHLTGSKGYKELTFDYVNELEKQKEMTIQRLKEEMPNAKFAELSSHLERTTKLIELLEGRATERVENDYTQIQTNDLEKEIIDIEAEEVAGIKEGADTKGISEKKV